MLLKSASDSSVRIMLGPDAIVPFESAPFCSPAWRGSNLFGKILNASNIGILHVMKSQRQHPALLHIHGRSYRFLRMGPYTEDQGTFSSPEVASQGGQHGEGHHDEIQENETLLPSDKILAKTEKKVRDYSPLKRLWLETFKPNAGYLTLGVVAMFGSSAANMAFPSLVGRVLDRTATRVDKAASAETCSASSMQSFALRALVVFLGGAVASCVRTHSLRMAREGTTRRLRKKLLKALMRQEKSFFDDTSDGGRRTGQLMSVLEADVEAAGEVFTTRLADGLRSMSSAFNGTAMLLRLSPKLTAVSLGLVPVFSAAIVANVLMTRRLTARHRELSAAAAAFVNERLGNLTTVHAFTNEGRDAEEYGQLLDQAHEVAAKVSMAKGAFMGGLFFAGSATLTSVLFFGGSLAGAGEMTIGDLTSFCIYTGLVGLGYSGISSWVSDTLKAAVAARRVFDLVDREPVVDPDEGVVPASSAKGDIMFEGVKFAYPSRGEVEVLRGVDLHIDQGKVVAFVGPSGAGKSTILSLLLRLYEPSSGRVLLDGVDISTLKPAWVRSQMGLVEQEPALFSGTIADNIRYGKPGATEAEVVKAAKDADAHEFITAFPDGYATYVGERGNTQLSGGQRQRVALARALIREPPVLLLDEATAHLDNESERLVQKALEKAMHGRTVIIVAHRLSTVEKAGEIVVMEEGQVVERGSFRELMSRDNGHFKALYSVAGSQ